MEINNSRALHNVRNVWYSSAFFVQAHENLIVRDAPPIDLNASDTRPIITLRTGADEPTNISFFNFLRRQLSTNFAHLWTTPGPQRHLADDLINLKCLTHPQNKMEIE